MSIRVMCRISVVIVVILPMLVRSMLTSTIVLVIPIVIMAGVSPYV